MDSTENGRSDENQPKKLDDILKLIQNSGFKKINIEDLPVDEQEKIWELMDMIDDDVEPELLVADFTMQADNIALFPTDILADMYRNALVDEEFEDAKDIGDELNNRGYDIKISDNEIIFTLKLDLNEK